jgi:SAM-dependent methyltransferase
MSRRRSAAAGVPVGRLRALNDLLSDVRKLEALDEIASVVAGVLRFERPSVAPYVPTPQDVVDRALALARVGPDDIVYDLGCGDGRIVSTAARRYGARGLGIDLDAALIAAAARLVRRRGVSHLVTLERGDLRRADVGRATVITLFLRPEANRALRPTLRRRLAPGARVVSQFDMGVWKPDRIDSFLDRSGNPHTLYLWIAKGAAAETGSGNRETRPRPPRRPASRRGRSGMTGRA